MSGMTATWMVDGWSGWMKWCTWGIARGKIAADEGNRLGSSTGISHSSVIQSQNSRLVKF